MLLNISDSHSSMASANQISATLLLQFCILQISTVHFVNTRLQVWLSYKTTCAFTFLLTFLATPAMAELPSFMRTRRAASKVAEGEEGGTAKRRAMAEEVVKEAQELAGKATGKGGGKGKERDNNSSTLHQLVIILTRLSLSMSNDLREVLGMLMVTFLVPIDFILAKASLEAGLEYQEEVKEMKEAKKAKGKDAEEAEEVEEDGQELDNKTALAQGPPHLFIAMSSIFKLLEVATDSLDKTLLLKWWKDKIEGKSLEQIADNIKIWRCRKPQKMSKVKGMKTEYAKLSFAVAPDLEGPLTRILLAAGSQRKSGKAPRSWLEREASALLNKFQKKK